MAISTEFATLILGNLKGSYWHKLLGVYACLAIICISGTWLCQCFVSLPLGTLGWSVVCDRGKIVQIFCEKMAAGD